jgi:hypothetical protein
MQETEVQAFHPLIANIRSHEQWLQWIHAATCNGRTSGSNHIETLRIAVIYSTLQSLIAAGAWFGSSKTIHLRDLTV